MSAAILTLTTDFGTHGPYVASIKGVVLGLAPKTQIVDVTHSISPQNIAEAAFILASIVDDFPSGTIHLAVVDPGVGTSRRVIAVEVQGQTFILPDNGLIGGVLRDRKPSGIWEITNPSLRRSQVSATFHGRDIMAPAAAHLLNGGEPGELGPRIEDPILTPTIEPVAETEGWLGQVVFSDPFGNLITNIHRDQLAPEPLATWQVEMLDHSIDGLIWTYGDRPPGSLVALIGSSDRVEVAIVNGNAARRLQAGPGTPVRLRSKRERQA